MMHAENNREVPMMRQMVAVRGEAPGNPSSGPQAFELLEGIVGELAPPSGPVETSSRRAPTMEVQIGERTFEARRAVGCLLAPATGDRVVAVVRGDEAFVLSVLEREGDAAAIELGAGVALEIDEEKSVTVRGARDLHLDASHSVTATSPEVRVRASRASIIAKKVEAVGASLESSFDQVLHIGRIVELVADEVASRLKRSLRFVSEIDQTRAGVVDVRAAGTVTVHGENTCVTARQIAKIDSNQIHIG
jgi:hypothetical protein